MRRKHQIAENKKKDSGFSILEMMIASVVLLVGILSVVQLVPFSLQTNRNSRQDTTATVIAQRELDQIVNQPINNTTFTDADGRSISLGDPTQNNVIVGGPVNIATGRIDFSQTAVTGYNYTYTDPNDGTGTRYQVRWAVITTTSGGNPVSKRIIIACWGKQSSQITVPVNIDTTVQK